ncbi:MAG TPA: hypothetical protein VGC57_09835 [Cellulomonas sp.]
MEQTLPARLALVPAGGDPSPRPGPATDGRLDAERAAARTSDRTTGLPLIGSLRSALDSAAKARTAGQVVVVEVRVAGLDLYARRHGADAARRVHQAVGARLDVGGGTAPGSPRRSVFVRRPGGFLIARRAAVRPDRSALVGEADRLRRAVLDVLRTRSAEPGSPPVPEVAVAVVAGGPRTHLLDRLDAAVDRADARGPVGYAEPVVSVRSGRLRAVHVRPRSDRTERPVTVDEARWLLPATVEAVRAWGPALRSAVSAVWIDLQTEALLDAPTATWLGTAWPAAEHGGPRLGIRLRADARTEEPTVAAVLDWLVRRGVRVAVTGLGTGLPELEVLDTRAGQELVVDAGLIAGAASRLDRRNRARPDDRAREEAAALAAVAGRRSILSTADGVDDPARLAVAAGLGLWTAEGELFGGVVPLDEVATRFRPGVDLRPAGAARAATEDVLGEVAEQDGQNDERVLRQVRHWVDEGATPAHVRTLLNSSRGLGRWSAARTARVVVLALQP